MPLPQLRVFVVTMAVASAGAMAAYFAAFPAPFLVGPAVAVTLGGILGLRLGVPVTVRNASFIVIGMSMGTGLTPEVFV
ncbi:MAG TPA: AbrB family transcriptional regulator, partial [Pseudorhizobium sp.]|nr:AbrB family transcriptional regulator [Pseudorhizobium sp.]